jgi:response regulator of citrate/malate metabolism
MEVTLSLEIHTNVPDGIAEKLQRAVMENFEVEDQVPWISEGIAKKVMVSRYCCHENAANRVSIGPEA